MFGFLKFAFLCLLAVMAGVAAVSIPFAGKTAAEHVRGLVDEALGQDAAATAPARPAGKPAPGAPVRMARQRPALPPADQAPADDHTDEDRAALERLIGQKVR